MKDYRVTKKLSSSDEISSIIYALLATVSSANHISNRPDFDVVSFVIGSMYDLDFPIYKHLDFITRDGGARYVMNDVSSYRIAKDFNSSILYSLNTLFSKYGCRCKEDVINFIKNICVNHNLESYNSAEVKKALMAYETYYKNRVIISEWPSDDKLLHDFEDSRNASKDVNYIIDNYVDIAHDNGTVAFSTYHARYPDSCMLLVASGIKDVNEDSAAYMFYEGMNEWFFNSNPYDDNFEDELASFAKYLNDKIIDYLKENRQNSTASMSLSIITEDKTFICSVGDTRVYTIKDNRLNRIIRKETYLDDIFSGSITSLPKDFALSFPSGYIGVNNFGIIKYNPDFDVLDSNDLDGILILTSDVYHGMPSEDLDVYVSTFDEPELLKMLSMYREPVRTNGYALYKKRSNK